MMNNNKLKQLDHLFHTQMQKDKIKGASLLVEHRGRTELNSVYGTDREDSIYKIYSMTKPVTATAVMILYERGLISLADPVSKYLDGFADMKVLTESGPKELEKEITLKHLLNMTSGLVYPGEASQPERIMEQIRIRLHQKAVSGAKMSNLDIINELAGAPLLFQPGTGWHYGISADVLAGVVEAVSGQPYGDFLKNEIFEPLSMPDTGFYIEEKNKNRLAVMYKRIDENGRLAEAEKRDLPGLNLYAPFTEPFIQSGGGGLYSTLKDYHHFVTMLMNKGTYKGREILGRKTVEYMSANQLNKNQLDFMDWCGLEGYGYGNLMRVMLDPAEAGSNGSAGEFGWDGMVGTYFFVDPKEELLLIYMQQIMQGGDVSLRRRMNQIVYGALND